MPPSAFHMARFAGVSCRLPDHGVNRALQNEGGGGAVDPFGAFGPADVGGDHRAFDGGGRPAFVPH